jgi:DNA-binding transcriptional ArsR family regulator
MHAMDKFAALADPTRRQIIELLASKGELSATAIAGEFSSSPPAISQHLKVLREAHLVVMEKRAQQRIYRLNPPAMSELDAWIQKTTDQWNERFNALDRVLEREKKKLAKRSQSK